MAQISAADVTEIVKLGKDTVAAGYNQIQATFTGHQTLAFQGGDKTAIIPGSWQEYNVPLQVVQNLSLETAMVSYANVVTHRQKRALMGVEKGQSKSGGVLDPTKAEALADRYREVLTDKLLNSKPLVKSTKELSDLYDQIRDLKEKANKLYSQAQMNYKSAKDEEAQGRLTGKQKQGNVKAVELLGKSEQLRTRAYKLEGEAKEKQEDLDKIVKNILQRKINDISGGPGGKIDEKAIRQAIVNNVTEDIDNGFVATVCPIKFIYTISKINEEEFSKRINKLKVKVKADYDAAWEKLHTSTFGQLTGKRVEDTKRLQRQHGALIGAITDQRRKDAASNSFTDITLDKVTVEDENQQQVQQELDGKLKAMLAAEQTLWERRVDNVQAVDDALEETKKQFGEQAITSFTVGKSTTMGGLSQKVKRRYLDSVMEVDITPILGGEDTAQGSKIKVTLREKDKATIGTLWTEEDVTDAAIEFLPDGKHQGTNDLGNFMVRHMVTA